MRAEINRANVLSRFIASLRQEHWLALMLLALHGSLALELADPLAQALLISHFGFFLLWQPLWRGEQKLIPAQAILILLVATLLVVARSWWLIALWISVLFALIGGNVPGIKALGQRAISILAAVYLLSVLLMWVVPHLFADQTFPPLVHYVVSYGLTLPLLAMFFIRTRRAAEAVPSHYSLDIFYSVLIFLLTVGLVLGAFAIKQISQGNYVLALTQALFVFAVLLIALSWLWDPRAGFAGLGQIISRYFLSVGVPFERWMHSLSSLADREPDPDKFVVVAAHELGELPWLSGVHWQAAGTNGLVGEETKHVTTFTFGGLTLAAYTQWTPGPALILHIRLLARLLGDYYEAKVREAEQRRMAYLQAIYETGSRLTHDVKNLLQTLKSLCAVAETSDEEDAESVRLLMKRQLPQIAQRLQITLDKLANKPLPGAQSGEALTWWVAFKQRFAHEPVRFEESDLPEKGELPSDLFESVAENLLQNAMEKRKLNPNLGVSVRLGWTNGYMLSVCDDGEPVDSAVAQQLFQAPVSSKTGFGVGLYQSARFAAQQGYALSISSNLAGNVCFTLRPASSAVRPVSGS